MKKLADQPYDLFLLTAITLLLYSFIPNGRLEDIHLHDTMIVLAHSTMMQIIAILLLLIWVLYRTLTRFLQRKILTWFHLLATLLPVILIVALSATEQEARPDAYDIQTYKDELRLKLFSVGTLGIIMLLGQFSFLINLLAGIVNLRKRN